MAASQGTAASSSAYEFMASLAANILSGRPAAGPAMKSADSPRTIPIAPPPSPLEPSLPVTAPLTASSLASSASSAKQHVPQSPLFTFSANSTATSSQGALTPTPTFTMADPDRGPSLLGSYEQLEAARKFAQSATKGGQKDRRGRGRLLSKEGSSGSGGSRSTLGSGGFGGFASSSRTPINPPASRSTSTAFPPSPSNSTSSNFTTRRSDFSAPAATGAAALHGRPTAGTSNSAWASFADNPTKKDDGAVKDTMKSFANKEASSTSDPTFPSKPQGTFTPPAKSYHMAEITNTLQARAKDGPTPPHLRAKATASESNSTSISNGAMENAKPAVDRVKTTAPTASATFTERATPFVEHKPAPVQQVEKKNEEAVVVKISGNSNGLTNGGPEASKSVETSTVNGATATFVTPDQVKELLVGVNSRIKNLEEENLALQKQLEEVVQHEEGRKFLGTDNAKVPFFINIMTHDQKIISAIQVNSTLQIKDLIRRVRIKGNYTAAATKNPYISLNGTKLGHLLTLGEIGVAKDQEYKNLVFGFDDVEGGGARLKTMG